MPGWLQALAACAPVVVYGIAYFLKWQQYRALGLPHTLVSVGLEDVLFLVVVSITVYCSMLLTEVVEIARNKLTLQMAYELFISVLIVAGVASFTNVLFIADAKGSIDVAPAVFCVLQVAMIVVTVVLMRADKERLQLSAASKVGFFVVWGCLIIAFASAQWGYVSTNTGEYQVASDSGLLVVDYLDSGYGIVKIIDSIDGSNVLHVGGAYEIRDITSLNLEVEHFRAVVVDGPGGS